MRGQKPVLKPYGEVIDLPAAKARVPDPPSDLSPGAVRVWWEVAPILVARNIYSDDTHHSLMAYCIQFARFVEADKMIEKQGSLVNGKSNRHFGVSNAAFGNMMRLAVELGLTPISRGRIQRIQ